MGIKTKIKKLFEQKAYLPISHPVSSEKEFEGKVALISGGSGGIGMSIAKSLKESGCTVVIAGTNEKKLEAIRLENKVDTIVMNYSCPDTFEDVVQEVVSKHGRLDIFISSAGVHGDYADEILTREDFLNYNELYSKRIEEYDRKITELEAERQNLQTAPNAYPFLDVYRKYRKLEEITRPMVVELIEKIEVYEGNRVEITFRFHDEIADLLEELHQKQMGQREVSA